MLDYNMAIKYTLKQVNMLTEHTLNTWAEVVGLE